MLGPLRALLDSIGAAPAAALLPVYLFQVIANLQPPNGNPFVSLRFGHGNGVGMPFILGVFGPPDPVAVAAPEFFQVFSLPAGVPTGLTIVPQVYAYDGSLSFPHNILVSPPRVLAF